MCGTVARNLFVGAGDSLAVTVFVLVLVLVLE